jgi:peptidyl-prolyl cis-trans isomerase D
VVKPLADVKAAVVTKLQSEKAAEKAHEQAVVLLDKVKSNQNFDELVTQLHATVTEKKSLTRFGTDIPSQLSQAVFKLAKPQDKAVSADINTDDKGNASVLILTAVTTGDDAKNAQLQKGLSQQLIKLRQEQTYAALIEQLRQEASIKYTPVSKQSAE